MEAKELQSRLTAAEKRLFSRGEDALSYGKGYGSLSRSASLLAATAFMISSEKQEECKAEFTKNAERLLRYALGEKTPALEYGLALLILYPSLFAGAFVKLLPEVRSAFAVFEGKDAFHSLFPHGAEIEFYRQLFSLAACETDARKALSDALSSHLAAFTDMMSPDELPYLARLLLLLGFYPAKAEEEGVKDAFICFFRGFTSAGLPLIEADAFSEALCRVLYLAAQGSGEVTDLSFDCPMGTEDFFAALWELLLQKELVCQDDGRPLFLSDASYSSLLLAGKQRSASLSFENGFSFSLSAAGGPLLLSLDFRHLSARAESVTSHTESYKGGFLSYGETRLYADTPYMSEECPYLSCKTAVAVLPDDETVLLLAEASALSSLYDSVKPLSLTMAGVPSEGGYYFGGERHLRARLGKKEDIAEVGHHCHIGDLVGAVSAVPMRLSLGENTKETPDRLTPISERRQDVILPGEHVSELRMAFAIGSIRRTYALNDGFLTLSGLPAGVKSVSCIAANRKRYTLLYNLSGEPFVWEGHAVQNGEAALLSWDR